MIKLKLIILGIILTLIYAIFPTMGQIQTETTTRFANPIDPVDAIIDTFKTYSVVALSEGDHRNIPGHEFRLALLQDPRFSEVVNDIVVEFGNSFYQEVMDRFTSGKEVTYDELRPVWEKTTQTNGVWNVPIYYEFFLAVRNLNKTLPRDRQIRVLLGDPPVGSMSRLDSYPAGIIEREVLAKSRRALIVYGGGHLNRKQLYYPLSDQVVAERMFNNPDLMSIVAHLENKGTKVFSIWATANDELILLQPDAASWKTPSLVIVKDTVLGLAPFTTFYPGKHNIMYPGADGQRHEETLSADPKRSGLIQDQFDAILTLGPRSSIKYSK